jgi:regulator of protease activity HflC (stomatin/prohibitin superfamily)
MARMPNVSPFPRMPAGPSSKFIGTMAALIALAILGAFTVNRCSVTVESGEVGIKTTRFGPNPGVQLDELPPGWHWKGIGERIIVYPTRQRTYSYTREANTDGKENEEICFADVNGLPMCADVNLTLKVRENRAADLYSKWRLTFEDLLDGQIRNDVRSYLAKETEKVPVSCSMTPGAAKAGEPPTAPIQEANCPGSLLGSGRQAVLQRAFGNLQRKWAIEGVDMSQMEWVGTIRYPDSVTQAITARAQAEQATLATLQKVAQANAESDRKIAEARGLAEATRLRAEALRANPEVLRQEEIAKWNGMCPLNVKTCIVGGDARTLVQAEP